MPNGTIIGMLSEVHNGVVDTSVAGYAPTLERYEVVDFSQGIIPTTIALMIKRPSKTDVSVRYFWLGLYNFYHLLTMYYVSW